MKVFSKVVFYFIFFIWVQPIELLAQGKISQFLDLSLPEKKWVMAHPIKAQKAFYYTDIAKEVADSLKGSKALDKDMNGGQLDAFRHAYWMALMTQTFSFKAAMKMGEAHEKSNKAMFFKLTTNENRMMDKPSCKMDLINNLLGYQFGKNNASLTEKELINALINEAQRGGLVVLKKHHSGQYLDEFGCIIPEIEWLNKWQNRKVLIASNFIQMREIDEIECVY